jgi:hypothetical protein
LTARTKARYERPSIIPPTECTVSYCCATATRTVSPASPCTRRPSKFGSGATTVGERKAIVKVRDAMMPGVVSGGEEATS